ncbi:hypothetical protein PHPALM_30037 [Phytophthora palmivora]|uniref:Uncharacterized protein n=1 Tax=Phytophthora palmivora TaxID=4796 RepID=A0A2P4X653_9STRA|nr:hypothetical protein PHPALM_30037 [Phytophthora palmivora]
MKCAEMTDGTIDAEMINVTAAEMTREMYAEKTVEVIDAEKRILRITSLKNFTDRQDTLKQAVVN